MAQFFIRDIVFITDHMNQFGFLLFSFVAAVLASAYLWGFIFSKSSSAYKTIGVFNLFGKKNISLLLIRIYIIVLFMIPHALILIFEAEEFSSDLIYMIKIIAVCIGPYYTMYEGNY